jgi:hypothetical protein
MVSNIWKQAVGLFISLIGILTASIIFLGQFLPYFEPQSSNCKIYPCLQPPNPDLGSIAIGAGIGIALCVSGIYVIHKSRMQPRAALNH